MSSSSSSTTRLWRTAFLTLRDETSTGSPASIGNLLDNLLFSNKTALISAASHLPPTEVSSDLLFLLELVANTPTYREDISSIFTNTCHLIHDIWHHVSVEFNSSSCSVILNSFQIMVEYLSSKAGIEAVILVNTTFKPVMECLETVRRLTTVHREKILLAEDIQLVEFLIHIIACFHAAFVCLYTSNANQRCSAETGKRLARCTSLWEVQTLAFTMLGEVFSRAGSLLPVDLWQSAIEVLRKVMDVLASRSVIVEGNQLSRFYSSLLNCLHLVLMDTKSSLSDHMSVFVAALRLFFVYGLTSRSKFPSSAVGCNEPAVMTLKEPGIKDRTPYRPPHLRRKDSLNIKQSEVSDSLSDREACTVDVTSSDSDYSDNDGSLKNTDDSRSAKVRVAAIACLQDLCQVDPKSFSIQWTILLPTNDVLQPRKFEATLMTCLLFDPYLKVRMASASALAVMLDGRSSVFLQVAEYKGSTKFGSFVPLSSSLGLILMQLHSGILYLIQQETRDKFLASLLKILMLLISCTPYSRMPEELLLMVIKSLQAKIEEGFPSKSDQTSLVAAAISCLTAALSTSSSSLKVKEMFLEEVSSGFTEADKRSGVLFTLFQCSDCLMSPTVSFEALQALKAVSHNHPSIILPCWTQVSITVFNILKNGTLEVPMKTRKGNAGNTVGYTREKVVTAAIKVLDECLRAISGFKGTEDLFDDKLLDTPFTSDLIRTKKVSSAPLYEHESPEDLKKETEAFVLGREQWLETTEKHMPFILWHSSAMVRTASVTCFAGITSLVFSSLSKESQDFIISTLINAALHDEVPSVRSAACRAIGVISCFPQVSKSAEILDKFVHAVEINTRNPLAMVRITASWALANICDSLRHSIDEFPFELSTDSNVNSKLMESLTECALRLTKDGDKIKSNAVRALGNLSRFGKYTKSSTMHVNLGDCFCLTSTANNKDMIPSGSHTACSHVFSSNSFHLASLGDSCWLEKVVQAFLSCVTTGNVKVQWNVCHAFGNLFLNETISLQDMDWAPSVFSILLLLLRDSSNFKIRIQAAAALAVPASVFDYGKSFSDVVQGLQHILENLGSDQISAPSSFKYRLALEKQLTATMLHVLSLAATTVQQLLKEFLVKKATFLEGWFKELCNLCSLTTTATTGIVGNQKKEMISKALRALIEVYQDRNQLAIAHKFEELDSSIR